MPSDHQYYVYLLTNRNNTVMYVGMTSDLRRRIYQHKKKLIPGFTQKYNVHKLVYYETTDDVRAAIAREKEIKKWRREKKNNLVITANPEWKDLGRDGSRSTPALSSLCLRKPPGTHTAVSRQ